MRRRNLLTSLIAITIISLGSLAAVLITGTKPQLGLDLQGGASVTLSPVGTNYTSAALDQIPKIYRQRINSLGVAETEVNRQGNHIVVNLPGVKNKDEAIKQIATTGKVVFRPALKAYSALQQFGAPISPCTNTSAPQVPPTTNPSTAPASTADSAAPTSDSAGPTSASAGSDTAAPATSADTAATTVTSASAATVGSSPSSSPGASRTPHAFVDSLPTATSLATPTTAPSVIAPSPTAPASTTPGSVTTPGSTPDTGASTPDTVATTTADTAVTTTTEPYTGPSTTTAPIPPVFLTSTQADDPTQQVYLAENPKGDSKCTVFYQLGPAFAYGEKAISGAAATIVNGQWAVELTLKDGANGLGAWNQASAQCFDKVAACAEGGMAIVLDHQVISAPGPRTRTFDGTGVEITGNFSRKEAENLAQILAYGASPVEMKIDTTQQVSATLGKNSLRAAILAGLIGIGLVMVFMLLYYRSLALIVLAGIAVSGALLWAIIALFSRQNGLRLSLSGITGIIVSVGVTVDSYVVFFERLKDEVRGGKTLRSSALRGFRGAWRTILAADVVSLIGAVVLFVFSVGSVRGFAFFLGLSTAVDLVIAYTFTRPAVLLIAQSKRYRSGDVFGVHSGEAYAGGAA
jgi:preprotein translocase subunit SecD